MRFYSDSDFQNLLGEKIGSGTEKICYLSKINPCRCFKVGLKGNCSQIKREVDYFNSYGKNVKISFASGWAVSSEYVHCTMLNLFDEADKYMYENKQGRQD